MINKTIDIIGIQMDLGAVRKGVDMGPSAIRHAGLIEKIESLGYSVVDRGDVVPAVSHGEGSPKMRYSKEINDANDRLFSLVDLSHKKGDFPLILGGDHCIAAGSIPASVENCGSLGVIWVDAHGDYNDPDISPTGNMHGMPLSAVCGLGPDCMVDFSDKRINPKNVVIIGARALDPKEKEKLYSTGVTVFSMNDVHTMGMAEVMQQAIRIALDGTNGLHLSFDMDALDPAEAPGVGTPVLNGLTLREAFIACEQLAKTDKLVSMDLVETNPLLDEKNKTGILATELILTCLGSENY